MRFLIKHIPVAFLIFVLANTFIFADQTFTITGDGPNKYSPEGIQRLSKQGSNPQNLSPETALSDLTRETAEAKGLQFNETKGLRGGGHGNHGPAPRPIANASSLSPLNIQSLIDDLADPCKQSNAISLLLKAKKSAIGPLSQALSNANPMIRQEAAWILGLIGDTKAISSLYLTMRMDNNHQVKKYASVALGTMGTKAIGPLLSAYMDASDDDQRVLGGQGLQEIADRSGGINTIIQHLSPKELPADIPFVAAQELAGLLKRSKQFHIDFPFRLPMNTFKEIIRNRSVDNPDGRPLAVVVYPKNDWNGGFYDTNPTIRSLIEHNYRVMFYEAETDTDMINSLKGATNQQKASIIVLGGHGSRDAISFGTDDPATYRFTLAGNSRTLNLNDQRKLSQANISSTLIKNGQIILESCSTGEGKSQKNNIANLLRKAFPQARAQGIWAPTLPTSIDSLKFNSHDALDEVKYRLPKDKVYRASIDLNNSSPCVQPS